MAQVQGTRVALCVEASRVRRRSSTGDRALFGVALVGLVITLLFFVSDPEDMGGTVRIQALRVLAVVIAVGPLLRRARPRHIWLTTPLCGAGLLATTFDQDIDFVLGPFDYSDFPFLLSYTCLIVLFVLLARLSDRRRVENAVLDAAAGTVGVALALWSSALAPLAVSDLPSGVVWALYPPLDALLLALGLHLALRVGMVTPPLAWFLAGAALWFLVDTSYTIVETFEPGRDVPLLEVGTLIAHFSFAVAFAHPRVGELSATSYKSEGSRSPERAAAFAVLTISPVVLAVAVPLVGLVDAVVRIGLVVALLALLFVRMTRTVSALSVAQADSHHRATHDGLTGLLNRPALLAHLDAQLVADRERGAHTVVLFIDCDDFKRVNDTWGHHAGDTLLRDVSTRLPERLRGDEVLARHGGDEFVVVGSVDDVADAPELGRRVQRFFADPLRILPERVHTLSPSIGLVVADPGDPIGADEVLGRADAAMYEAKQRGKGRVVVHDAELARRSRERARIGDRLEIAVRSGEVEVFLQPVMGGPDYGHLVGWEALARWDDAELGSISPDVFIPLAEQLGLIADLGRTLLGRALVDVAALRAVRPDDDLWMSVNISPVHLLQPNLAEAVLEILRRVGLPASALRLEVTETYLVDRGPAVMDALDRLRAAGVLVCVDDFGTGYASLATLSALPVDTVKLDRSLVVGLGAQDAATRRVSAVLALLASLGIERIVAEGVETPEQAAELTRLGCPLVQGWLYGRPTRSSEVVAAFSPLPL